MTDEKAAGAIRWDEDAEGVVTLTLSDPGQRANTLNESYMNSMDSVLERLDARREDLSGVIVASSKPTFFAGADLEGIHGAGPDRADELFGLIDRVKSQFRRLETLGLPTVAAISGAALGGGLELALATHHRICVDDPRVKVGLPEVGLGLIPGGGGIVRTVRMFGIVPALTTVLLEGKSFGPAKALKCGLVDELVTAAEDLAPAAKRWIAENPEAVQPWDKTGYSMPGGTPDSPKLAAILPAIPANLRKQLKGANFPAPLAIASAAVEGAQVDFENAIEIEGRYFVNVATGQVSTNMTQAFFFDMKEVTGDRGPAGDAGSVPVSKAVVLGAGMMGAGIAHACAAAGIDVVLKDVSAEAAERGREYTRRLVGKAVERGRMTEEVASSLLGRIVATDDPAAASGADLVIEAVFEDPAIKAGAMAEIEPHLADGAMVGSNTSTLPITELADSVEGAERFIGLHFFSPVDRMPLLEIIRGAATSDETVSRALSLARQLRKTPILVNDSPGFFTSRVIKARLNEGIAMLGEGIAPATIEQASSQAGYPAPVLQLCDEVSLDLLRQIREAARAAAETAGGEWVTHPAEPVIDQMVGDFNRPGKAAGAGFYEYSDGRRGGLWPGLAGSFGSATSGPVDLEAAAAQLEDLRSRLLFAEVLEALRCWDEGVIESRADANVGSILGIGFPGWTGGVLQFVEGFEGGVTGFVEASERLAQRHGSRFDAPAFLDSADPDSPFATARSAGSAGSVA